MRLRLLCVAISTILLCCASVALADDYSINDLVEEARLREGPVAMRDWPGWDASRPIVIRDFGLELAGLDSNSIVMVSSIDEALLHVEDAGALIGFCDDRLLLSAPHISWVQIYSAGAERCLKSEVLASGEAVMTNMQKMSSPVIAEHAIAIMLALSRSLPTFIEDKEQGDWRRSATYTDGMQTVSGKTMLVLGLGGIGTEIARLAAALGMRVVATRNSSREGPDFVDYVGLSDEMLHLSLEADVIVNALPLTDQTRGLLGADFFSAAAQSGAPYFINVGRGATVDTDALLAALQSGHLAGVGLDVTDPEPLPANHGLWQADNVIITPHISSRGGDRHRHRMLVLENIRRYLVGDALLNVVDVKRGY